MKNLEETNERKRRRKNEIIIETIVEGNEGIKCEEMEESAGTGQ